MRCRSPLRPFGQASRTVASPFRVSGPPMRYRRACRIEGSSWMITSRDGRRHRCLRSTPTEVRVDDGNLAGFAVDVHPVGGVALLDVDPVFVVTHAVGIGGDDLASADLLLDLLFRLAQASDRLSTNGSGSWPGPETRTDASAFPESSDPDVRPDRFRQVLATRLRPQETWRRGLRGEFCWSSSRKSFTRFFSCSNRTSRLDENDYRLHQIAVRWPPGEFSLMSAKPGRDSGITQTETGRPKGIRPAGWACFGRQDPSWGGATGLMTKEFRNQLFWWSWLMIGPATSVGSMFGFRVSAAMTLPVWPFT